MPRTATASMGSPSRKVPAAARKQPQGGSAKKKGKGKAPAVQISKSAGKQETAAPKKFKSHVINEMLADGYDYQIGFDHFKLDWKKKGEEKVADKYMQDGAWIPKKGSVKIDGKKVKGFIYVYNDEDEIYDEETGNPIGFVSEEDAKDWHNHVSAVAKKLLYRYTNGKALYEEGLLTLHEYCGLSSSNRKGKNWWIMLNGHMIPKSKNTSDMVKVLSKDLQKEIDEKAPAEKRGPQPHRQMVVGEKNIQLVEVDEYGNLLEDLTADTDDEEESESKSDDEEESESDDEEESESDDEEESEDKEESEDEEDTPIVAAKTGKKVAAKTGKKVAAKTGKSKKPADTDADGDEKMEEAPAATEDEEPVNEIFEQFMAKKKAIVVALYLEVTGQKDDPKGTIKSLRQELIDTHLNLDQLKQIASGAEIPNIVRITKVETLRKKIIQKLGDGKILAIPAAAPEPTSKKRKASADADADVAGSSKSAGKSARR